MTSNWATTRLGDLLAPVRRTISAVASEEYMLVTLPLYGKGARLRKTVLGSELGTAKYRVRTGDLMISKIDARKGSNSLLPPELNNAVVTGDFLSYEVDSGIAEIEFMDLVAKSVWFADLCDSVSSGTTNRVRLDVSRFLDLTISLPPLAEQRRIVDLIGSLDEAIVAAAEWEVNAQALLNNLSEELLFGRGWPNVPVSDLAAVKGLIGGPFGSSLGTKDYQASGVPVIRGKNMPSRAREISGAFVFVSTEKSISLRRNIALPGDVVFTQRGTLGQVGIVPHGHYEEYIVSQSQMRLRTRPEIASHEFVYFVFKTERMISQIKSLNSATANPHINLGILSKVEIPLPSVQEQLEIVDKLDALESALELKVSYTDSLRHLRSEMLTSLLSGAHTIPESYDELLQAVEA